MIRISKRFSRSLIAGALVFQIVPMTGCASKVSYEQQEYDIGTHQIIEVDRSFNPLFGKDGLYGLTAPDGYIIKDYDYDKTDSFEYSDFVYENITPVEVGNPDELGVPVEEVSRQDDVYEAGEHVLVDINRNFNLWIGKDDQVFHLTAPEGYSVLDYDYDKTNSFEFENITYANNQAVQVEDINQFGECVSNNNQGKKNSHICDVGEDMMVVIHRGFNPFWGKDEMKEVERIPGYKVIDYDYDKTDTFEFETIVYQNVVPVKIESDTEYGVPLEDVSQDSRDDGCYAPYEHVLVDINRDFNFLLGYEGTKQIDAPEGYEVLDYDYDNNQDFEFETTVYVNNHDVKTDSNHDFGKVYQKTRD